MITRYIPGRQVLFIRNPFFREWSAAAQPEGSPDRIVWTFGPSLTREAAADRGRAGRLDRRHAARRRRSQRPVPRPGAHQPAARNHLHRVQHQGRAVQRPPGPPRVQPRRRPRTLRRTARRTGPGHPGLPDPATRHPRLPALLPLHHRPQRLRHLGRPRPGRRPQTRGRIRDDGHARHSLVRQCGSRRDHGRLHRLGPARARLPGHTAHRPARRRGAGHQRLAPPDPGNRRRAGTPTTPQRRTSSTCSSAARTSGSPTPPPPATAPSSATPPSTA